MSGDMNTGLGNSILSYSFAKAWLRDSGVLGTVYCDGDDVVVIVEAADVNRLLPVTQFFAKLGMETKFDAKQIVRHFEHLEFCQCRPVEVNGNWRMVRNPVRVLSRMLVTPHRIQSSKEMLVYRKSIGMCELACSYGVPVLQSLANGFINNGKGKFDARVQSEFHRLKFEQSPLEAKSQPISIDTRLSFELAWGISMAEQLLLETEVGNWCEEFYTDCDLSVACEIGCSL